MRPETSEFVAWRAGVDHRFEEDPEQRSGTFRAATFMCSPPLGPIEAQAERARAQSTQA